MSSANWWPGTPGAHPQNTGEADDRPQHAGAVKVHAQNPNGYSEPDERQQRLMRGSQAVGQATVISRSRSDGAPTAFDPHKPGVVHVDPDEKDGGIVVDLRSVTAEQMQRAGEGAADPYDVYRRLGANVMGAEAPAAAPPRANDLMPGYVVPRSDSSGVQVHDSPPTVTRPKEAAMAQPRPLPATPKPATSPQPQAAQPGADLSALVADAVARALASQQPQPQQPQPQPQPQPQEDPPEEPRNAVVGPPLEEVIVDLGKLGQMSARYHTVVEGAGCLVLVYDTRYEGGSQWMPPDRGDETMKVYCPRTRKSYIISSMGLTFQLFEVMDIVVLITHPDEGPPAFNATEQEV